MTDAKEEVSPGEQYWLKLQANGEVSWEDFQPLCIQLGWNCEVAQALWWEADADRSGALDKEEFLAFASREEVLPYLLGQYVASVAKQEHDEHEYQLLFNALDLNTEGLVDKSRLLQKIVQTGLKMEDPLLRQVNANLSKFHRTHRLSYEEFKEAVAPALALIAGAIRKQLVIQDWKHFEDSLTALYHDCQSVRGGKVADYIPELALANPNHFGVAFCSVDGQRFEIGEVDIPFSIQSTSKPLTYLMALQELGEETVHRFIGREPSGRNFNELCLNNQNIPHNPCINSGAIMACSLVKKNQEQATRFRHIMKQWKRLTGHGYVSFSNTTYLSERASADRNFCLGYLMQGLEAFSKGNDPDAEPRTWSDTELVKTLELYFQCCSIVTNARSHAVVAATLAKGGVCPITNDRVFDSHYVSNATSLMLSCGMYDYSGEWAYKIGLPAKSGVSGSLLVVVPNVGGFCIYSPPLDVLGNTVRGIAFATKLVTKFNFHMFDVVNGSTNSSKQNPCVQQSTVALNELSQLCYYCAKGDLPGIRGLLSLGADINASDYDGRTPLHLAASEGQLEVVKLLVKNRADLQPVDRWGGTPHSDALREGHNSVAEYLEKKMSNQRNKKSSKSVGFALPSRIMEPTTKREPK
mmetsp:Transcript_21261/g.42214  ORF Transcript_21261/g.42214 Transcript_21261/m.42214 type:complete len:638 (-) Transcript_21261:247-2160(-)